MWALNLPLQPQHEALTASQYNTISFKLGFRKTCVLTPFSTFQFSEIKPHCFQPVWGLTREYAENVVRGVSRSPSE